ncbi:27 kDa hemolymph glycoprotein-like [Contarinia nasturtii]|uniref:27 kDa hemolymph glycoprotein-like n=1 Tax=Contarinia nasturtii TaxID=265458 RepID=UPI0012D4C1A9|nr:27 kDa hemolymph glycoprotein-like [Contarinia nasturtii]
MFKRNSVYFFVSSIILLTAEIQCFDNNDLTASLNTINSYATPNSIDSFKNVTKEKCLKVSGNIAAYDAIERSVGELKNCMSGLIDFSLLHKEIEDAKPTGELDTVFNKYCRKRDIAIGCLENFTTTLNPCLEPDEINTKETIVNIFKGILKFVCYKDGDQIALFIAEKGPECFEKSKDALLSCKDSLVNSYMPSGTATSGSNQLNIPTEIPQFVIGEKQCQAMDTLQTCAVAALEKCEESTPANLVDALFKFIRKETPCANIARSN